MADGKNELEMQIGQETHLLIHHSSDPSALPIKDEQTTAISFEPNQMLLVASNNVELPAVGEKSVPELEMSSTDLEEFMDIVTTYKCKFCPFSCRWKSGLMSHIRSIHYELTLGKLNSHGSNNQPLASIEKPKLQVTQVASHEDVKIENVGDVKIENVGDETTMVEKQIFLCSECNRGFASLAECKSHMLQDHQSHVQVEEEAVSVTKLNKPKIKKPKNLDEIKKSSCNEPYSNNRKKGCKRKIRPPRALEEDYVLNKRKRLLLEEPERTFRCSKQGCCQRFRSDENLNYHMQCHVSDSKSFMCPVCSVKLKNWRLISMHLWKVHTIDTGLYTCTDCTFRTYSSFKLETHRQIHGDVRAFSCETCGKSFKQLSQLRNHAVIHKDRKNMSEKKWYSEQKCDVCQRRFSDAKCLRKHLQAVHSKLKPFVCSFCGHMSARKAMLELHMRQHTGEKPFHCNQCDYRTGDHNSLRRHKMRHSGAKPYKCPHCSYACIQAISYKTHLKNKHPGLDGLYACSFCPFRSVNKSNYLNHVGDHKRGALPITSNTMETPLPISDTERGMPNVAAAQLIYSCLNALSHENNVNVSSGMMATSSKDGTQMITIQIPGANQELSSAEQYYLTVQPPHELVEAELSEQQAQEGYTLSAAATVDTAIQLTTDMINKSDVLSNMQLIPVSGEIVSSGNTIVSLPLILKQTGV